MKNVTEFVEWALTHAKRESVPAGAKLCVPLNKVGTEPWEYLYGTTGHKVTKSLIERKWKSWYSKQKSWTREKYDKATEGWLDKTTIACDCQGLEDKFSGADNNAQGNYSSYCTDKGLIKSVTRPYVIGEAVFIKGKNKITHVGWICGFMPDGDPLVVEERGLAHGCVVTRLSERNFTHRGLMTKRYLYDGKKQANPNKYTLKRVLKLTDPMMTGADVKKLQQALVAEGFNPGKDDGIFGGKTEKAVIAFQKKVFTDPKERDGKVGKKTAAKLGWSWEG